MKSITIWGEEGHENSHIDEIISGRKKHSAHLKYGLDKLKMNREPEKENS